VSLSLRFEVALSPFGVVFAKVFEELAGAQMSAFIERAGKIYGVPT
jgi:ribosome-associated toxin RatA of RatAB toxin-antitoxin module